VAVTDPRSLTWRKSTKSTTSNCVEVAVTDHAVLVRHSRRPDGSILAFSKAEWAAFLAGYGTGSSAAGSLAVGPGRDSATRTSGPVVFPAWAGRSAGVIGVPMALYALAAGILAVSAGSVVERAGQWGALTRAVALFVTVAITVAAGVAADPALRWLLGPAVGRSPRQRPPAPRADRRS
jgi:hypothetical protein